MHFITTVIFMLSTCGVAFGNLTCTKARPNGMCGYQIPGGNWILANLTPLNNNQPLVFADCQTTPFCGDGEMWTRVRNAMNSPVGFRRDGDFDAHCNQM
ncbi:hypothetical protein MJO28_013843 [Puccinia striiformis f. sp. tritici]|uniref:Uncharacterized protein n=1 Tax=Puccinia striiformis f. sp. tritici TaxID=168172 RepID=A0ACC0DVQ5_9BASI|nr:hypothetical protein MJO28_013843 [Puccinia striiformis f. sp. tritici]